MLEAPGHKTYDVDLTKTWDPSEIVPLDKTTTEKHSEGEIILTIRKPDMVGNSKWQFARGKFPVFAKITDEDWLSKFHDRKVKGLHSGDPGGRAQRSIDVEVAKLICIAHAIG